MSTVTIVQKNGIAAIAADQAAVAGSCKCPGTYKTRPSKIVQVGDSYVGVTGSTANVRVMESLARTRPGEFDLSSVEAIFETFRSLQKVLVEEYYVVAREDDEEQPYHSMQLDLLIANPTGIYQTQSYREVAQYEKFWASGSGRNFAVGAMEALYDDERLSAQRSAERAVEIGTIFDDASDLPVESYAVEIG